MRSTISVAGESQAELGRGLAARRQVEPASAAALTEEAEALARIQAVLKAIVEGAEVESSTTRIDLPLAYYGTVPNLVQGQYSLESCTYALSRRVILRCQLHSPEVARFQFPHAGLDMRFVNELRQHGLKILNSRLVGLNSSRQRAMFEVAGDIPVMMVFAASAHSGAIDVWINNFGELGGHRYSIAPERVDEALLCDLERFIMRESTDFLTYAVYIGESEAYNQIQFRLEQESPEDSRQGTSAGILSFEVNPLSLSKRLVITYRSHRIVVDAQNTTCSMGRQSPADIHVRSRFVSRDHASLTLENNEFVLHDHSSNGSFVKPEGQPAVYVQQGSHKLGKRGFISLGEEISPENANVILYEVD
ncbi:MAG: FHA domain-containing protein [Thiotrichales bacterium]